MYGSKEGGYDLEEGFVWLVLVGPPLTFTTLVWLPGVVATVGRGIVFNAVCVSLCVCVCSIVNSIT